MSCNTAYKNLISARAKAARLARIKTGTGKAAATSTLGLFATGVGFVLGGAFVLPGTVALAVYSFAVTTWVGSGVAYNNAIKEYRKALKAYRLCLAKNKKNKSVP